MKVALSNEELPNTLNIGRVGTVKEQHRRRSFASGPQAEASTTFAREGGCGLSETGVSHTVRDQVGPVGGGGSDAGAGPQNLPSSEKSPQCCDSSLRANFDILQSHPEERLRFD